MRASRIFALARTMRWANVDGTARKARAISSVVSPQTSRSVSAMRASGAMAECLYLLTIHGRKIRFHCENGFPGEKRKISLDLRPPNEFLAIPAIATGTMLELRYR